MLWFMGGFFRADVQYQCNIIWHFLITGDSLKIEKLQRKACSCKALLQKGKKDTHYLSRIKRMIQLIYKIVHGRLPDYLSDFIHLWDSNYVFRYVYNCIYYLNGTAMI